MRRHATRFRIGLLVGLVVVVALGAGTLVIGADNPKLHPGSPDAGKSVEERTKLYDEGWQAFQAKYDVWLAEFVAQRRDPRKLPRSQLLATYVDPLPDMATAVAKASLIVAARAERVAFRAFTPSIVTLAVTRVVKGDPARTIRILQTGGPAPDLNWGEGSLGYAENDPILLLGDEAVLFLEGPDADGTYYAQSFTGNYAITDGRVAALEGNPFAGQVDALSVDAFLADVEALAGR